MKNSPPPTNWHTLSIQQFCESAEAYAIHDLIWLVNGGSFQATYCSQSIYHRRDWQAVPRPSFDGFLAFCREDIGRKVAAERVYSWMVDFIRING